MDDLNKLDYLILACLVNSDESEKDIVDMVQRFIILRFLTDYNEKGRCIYEK